jgi:hypothetical protein
MSGFSQNFPVQPKMFPVQPNVPGSANMSPVQPKCSWFSQKINWDQPNCSEFSQIEPSSAKK